MGDGRFKNPAQSTIEHRPSTITHASASRKEHSMSDLSAKEIAEVLGGEPVQTEDEGWLVVFERPDGRVVTLSETSVEEYYDRAAFEAGRCYSSISLS
jgi:hypothetical protein